MKECVPLKETGFLQKSRMKYPYSYNKEDREETHTGCAQC